MLSSLLDLCSFPQWTTKQAFYLPLSKILEKLFLSFFFFFFVHLHHQMVSSLFERTCPIFSRISYTAKDTDPQIISLVQLFTVCPTLCNSMDCSTPDSLSITKSQSLVKLMSIKSVMLSKHLILCHPLLLLYSIFPRLRIFSNELVLHVRWPKYLSFSFSIGPSNDHSGLISLGLTEMTRKTRIL